MRILLTSMILSLLGGFAMSQNSSPLPSPKESKSQFDQADADLNQAWAKLKATLPADKFAELLADQRDWIQERDSLALSPSYSGAPTNEAAAKKSSEYLTTATELTKIRTHWLSVYTQPLKNNSLTGVWNDSNGGEMEIVEQAGKLYFSISVVRGPTAHTGDIDGVAKWKSPKAFFSDKGLVPDKTDETTLTFTLEGNRLKVTGVNTIYYHGARAYFDGTYLCTAPLSAEEQTKLTAP